MLDLEKEVAKCINEGLGDAIKARLAVSYGDNPLVKLVDAVVKSKEAELRAVISSAFDEVLASDFRDKMREACAHKLAKVLVGKMEGEIEKRANEIRSDPMLRSRITLAIEHAINQVGK